VRRERKVRGSERKRIENVLCSARREGDEGGSMCDWPCVFSLCAAVLWKVVLGLAAMGIEGRMFQGDVTVSQVQKAIGHAWPHPGPYSGVRVQRQLTSRPGFLTLRPYRPFSAVMTAVRTVRDFKKLLTVRLRHDP
jgi:hypothetical protein